MNDAGNVGIGTTTPMSMLSLQSSAGPTIALSSGAGAITTLGGLNAFTLNTIAGNSIVFQQSGIERLRIASGSSIGNIGVATSTPWRTLSVTGTVGLDGLGAITGTNSSLCLSANKEVVYSSNSDSCASSLRSTKHDIQNLNLDALAKIIALQPVSFVYNNDASSTVRYGFIAEDASAVDPHLGTYDQNGALSGINDRGFIAVIVEAVQTLSAEVQSLTSTVQGFAQSFTTHHLKADDLCLSKSDGSQVCVTGDQLSAFVAGTPASPAVNISPIILPAISSTSTPPSINIQGSNPATIHAGDTYTDLGAIVTDNQGHDLSYRTFINGALSGNILIDTSQVATDTIDYVATDTWGNTATSTRTVIIDANPNVATTSPSNAGVIATSTPTAQ